LYLEVGERANMADRFPNDEIHVSVYTSVSHSTLDMGEIHLESTYFGVPLAIYAYVSRV